MDCKNFEGSDERKVHYHQHAANSLEFIQQAANAAINGAIGTPVKKGRNQQIGFEVASNKHLTSWAPQFHQVLIDCLMHFCVYSYFTSFLAVDLHFAFLFLKQLFTML